MGREYPTFKYSAENRRDVKRRDEKKREENRRKLKRRKYNILPSSATFNKY